MHRGEHGLASEVRPVRLPVDPLDRLTGLNNRALARLCGIPERNLWRWRKAGLTAQKADELAAAVGVTPFDLWGVEYETCEGWEAEQRRAAASRAWQKRRKSLKGWPRPDSWRANVSICSDACRCPE